MSKKRKRYVGNSRSGSINKFRKRTFDGLFLFAQFVIDAYTFSQSKNLLKKIYEWYKNKYYAQRSFDGNFHVCSTCHNKLRENNIPCQAICNKMFIQVFPEQLSHWKRLERILVSQRILLKKVLIMHGKGEFPKIKGSICNVLIEASNG